MKFVLSIQIFLVFLGLFFVVNAVESPEDCINVEEPGYAGGDRQCFGTDEDGMVCGWDGDTPNEAYCEVGTKGLKVYVFLSLFPGEIKTFSS